MNGVNFTGAPLGQVGDSTLFRFVLLSQPAFLDDLIQSVEAGTASSYGGNLVPYNLHQIVADQSIAPMKDFALDFTAAPFTGSRTVTLWPQSNQLPSGDPIRYLTLRNCGFIAADSKGAPLEHGVTLRAFADSSFDLVSLATDTPSNAQAQKRYTTEEMLAWMKATKVKRNALVFIHFAVENRDQSIVHQQLTDALDRLEMVLNDAGYESFCIVPSAMAHMVGGQDYDGSMQRVREFNAEFLAAARDRPQTVAYVNLFGLSGEFMMVDGWRGKGDAQGLTIPPDNQANWQNWMRDHGYDSFELWDGEIVDLSAFDTLFDNARLHLNNNHNSAAAAFFYRALLWNEILTGRTLSPAEIISFDVIFGSHVEGGLDDIRESDDDYLRTSSIFGFTAQEPNLMEVHFGATSPLSSATTLAITIESRLNNPGGLARVRLRNWSTGLYEEVHTYSIGSSEEIIEIDVPQPAPFVRDTGTPEIDLAIRHSVIATFAAGGFGSFFDRVEIGVN